MCRNFARTLPLEPQFSQQCFRKLKYRRNLNVVINKLFKRWKNSLISHNPYLRPRLDSQTNPRELNLSQNLFLNRITAIAALTPSSATTRIYQLCSTDQITMETNITVKLTKFVEIWLQNGAKRQNRQRKEDN